MFQNSQTVMSVCGFMLINAVLILAFCAVSFAVDGIGSTESISDGRTLVSRNGMFEFGFFGLGNSKNRYVGIWYKKIPVQTVVWVANRCNPISDSSGLLMINSTGYLVLLDQNKSVVWSTILSGKAQKPVVQLLDSGNLVLREEENRTSEDYLWQSFDYPSDTLLPGMKIGWDLTKGLTWSLSAWKNWDDPCSSDFTMEVESREGFIRRGGVEYFRTGTWNGFGLSGAPDLNPSNRIYGYKIVYNANQTYYMYNIKNSSVITRVVLNQTTGTRQRLVWMEKNKSWRAYNTVPIDSCDHYNYCGANANCVISENPPCQCLKGFKPKSIEDWSLRDWSEGCVRNYPTSCNDTEKDRNEDDFLKVVELKLPDARNIWVNESMNMKECRAKCMSNCSCTAFANRDNREGRGCRIWSGDLLDIRQISESGQDVYVRIRASELEKAKAARTVREAILLAVLGLLFVALLVGCYFLWRSLKEKAGRSENITEKEEDLELPWFDFSTIIAATDNFSGENKLGEGGFGPVYRGRLEDGQEIAVKRLSASSGQGMDEFKNEVKLIANLQHRNLVKLLGCCIEREEKLLVYEFMPNKSLDSFIFDHEKANLLDWPKRFQIICGIARGLLYLHQDSRMIIIHRDLKANNILLDNKMNPKISDFGVARSFGGDQTEGNTNRVVGTYGYMAPEYAFSGQFSTKSDVYSFGVIVLEIVSGQKCRFFHNENHGLTLIGHAWKLMMAGRTSELLDSCLRESYIAEEVLRCVHVGLLCVQQRPIDRPRMSSVVLMLSTESELPQPEEPACYFMGTGDDNFTCTTNNLTISELVPR